MHLENKTSGQENKTKHADAVPDFAPITPANVPLTDAYGHRRDGKVIWQRM